MYYRPIEMCNKFEKESSKIMDINEHVIQRWLKYKAGEHIEDENVGLRYTIEDIDVIENKELAKDELKDNWERYMRELYCRAGKKNTVYKYEHSIMRVREESYPIRRYIYMG